MKQILTAIAFLFIGFTTSSPKLLKVEATEPQWQAILNVIDQSVAQPGDRIAAREFIIKQLTDTTINKLK